MIQTGVLPPFNVGTHQGFRGLNPNTSASSLSCFPLLDHTLRQAASRGFAHNSSRENGSLTCIEPAVAKCLLTRTHADRWEGGMTDP